MMSTQIKTIQFLDISFNNREEFLNFIKKNVIEFALKKQELFKAMDCNAEYFHKSKNSKTNIPIRIHTMQKDNVLTLKAYTSTGIRTLEFWLLLFKKEHPNYCANIIESTEYFTYKKTEKTLFYTSYNWVPFEKVLRNAEGFHLNKIGNTITDQGFKDRLLKSLKGRLLNELLQISKATTNFELTYFKLSNVTKKVIAFSTTPRTERGKPLEHLSFKVSIGVNVQLPSCFSLGQRTAYGLGVFERDYINHLNYENKNINLKANQKK